MTTIYGISNCDTMKKALKWLDEHNVEYRFHDYKKRGIEEERLRAWVAELGWEALLNRRGMMWRKLPEEVRTSMDEASAVRTMLETPSIIRRPVLDAGDARHIGFAEDRYRELFG